MTAHKHPDGTYSASDNEVWMPGAYASEKAVSMAKKMDPQALEELWAHKIASAAITEHDIKNWERN